MRESGSKRDKNLWQNMAKKAREEGRTLSVLAPMADVTDYVFRTMIAKYGKPDAMWTEFVSSDGICHPNGRDALLKDLRYDESEKPIIAQLFTSNPENMEKSARIVEELGFDGIDINMGCPDKTIEKQGAGACMIKNPELAIEVIKSAMRGAPNIPISVKTRVGYNKVEIDTWIPALLSTGIKLLTVHARTRKEMSLVPARWEHVAEVVKIRDEIQGPNGANIPKNEQTLIFGNGDIKDVKHGEEMARLVGADGVMIGRGIFGTPWLFNVPMYEEMKEISPETIKRRLEIMVEHTKLFYKELYEKEVKNFAVMKKHYKAYVHGWEGAKELRVKLMEAENADEVEKIVFDLFHQKV